MVKLVPGSLLKLLDLMNMEASKPIRDHRSLLLQVIDILPADLGDNDLWPKHGFFIKVSDSSHSIYASLPIDQDDLVLSNKIHLGQLLYVDRFEPGSAVPIIKGVKPLPGRHPLVGTPNPIVRIAESGERSDSKATNQCASSTQKRGSWGPDQNTTVRRFPSPNISKGMTMNFKESTPAKERSWSSRLSPLRSGRSGKEGSSAVARRLSFSGPLLSKTADPKAETSVPLRKISTPSNIQRNKIASERDPRTPTSPYSTENKNSITRSISSRNSGLRDSSHQLHGIAAPKSVSSHRMPLPAKLGALGKEAIQQREAARKIALQALRDASAAESLVRAVKMLSELNASAKPDNPAACFDRFLRFHHEIMKEVISMETAVTGDEESKMNRPDETDESEPNIVKYRRSSLNQKGSSDSEGAADDENRAQGSILGGSIRLAKQIQSETGDWFMDFLEAALEAGLNITRGGDEKKWGCCPQSLVLKVIRWVEEEQSDSSKRSVHHRAAQVARKLRMRVKYQ